MSYRNLVQGKLRQAFNAIKDLARIATFETKTDKEFNFSTGDLDYNTGTISCKVVVTDESKLPGSNKVRLTLMVKNKDIGDIKSYDTMKLEDVLYKIDKVDVDDKFVSIIQVVQVI